MQEKLKELKKYLEEENENTSGLYYNTQLDSFALNNFANKPLASWKIYTDEEADEAAAKEVKETLWAFNADFILEHSKLSEATEWEKEIFKKSLEMVQGEVCEGANPLVLAIIDDLEAFTAEAIEADGRGHFLSWYDGEEIETENYYIYRID